MRAYQIEKKEINPSSSQRIASPSSTLVLASSGARGHEGTAFPWPSGASLLRTPRARPPHRIPVATEGSSSLVIDLGHQRWGLLAVLRGVCWTHQTLTPGQLARRTRQRTLYSPATDAEGSSRDFTLATDFGGSSPDSTSAMGVGGSSPDAALASHVGGSMLTRGRDLASRCLMLFLHGGL